jgi:hypothetical protein
MSRFWSESPYIPITWTTSGLRPRAASSSSRSHATLSAAGSAPAGRSVVFTPGPSRFVRSTIEPGSPSWSAALAASAACRSDARSRRFEYAYP